MRTAIGIADAEGLSALSMRAVAARLGAATMSPYRYVTGKDDLVLLMADAVFAEAALPSEVPGHWRARLEAGARALWAVHRAHPWLAQLGPLTRPLMLPHLMAYSEWMLSALDGHGLAPAAMLNQNVLLYSHVQGLAAQLEREARPRAPPASPRTSGWTPRHPRSRRSPAPGTIRRSPASSRRSGRAATTCTWTSCSRSG